MAAVKERSRFGEGFVLEFDADGVEVARVDLLADPDGTWLVRRSR